PPRPTLFPYTTLFRSHLYSIASMGGAPILLTPGDFDVEDVTLSADNRSIIYSSNQDDVDRRHLWRVPVAGGIPQPLTRGEAMERSEEHTSELQSRSDL